MPEARGQARTVAAPARVHGRGLFTGAPGAAAVLPAEPGTGVRFVRKGQSVPALVAHVAPPPAGTPARCTSLGAPPIMTVEHILSALAGLGITDAAIEVEGPEVPMLDGSSEPFAGAIMAAGVVEGPDGPEPLRISREITVEAGGGRITARPRERGCLYRYELDYGGGSPIAAQSAQWDSGAPGAPGVYLREVAPARTFCLESEAVAMREAGLFAHLSPRDMLVFGGGGGGPIDNTLRFQNEPARHKLLDLIGDLSLAGRPIAAEITAVRSGHALNHAIVRALLAG